MKRETITFNGFGFPIILSNVKMRLLRGEYVPEINYNDLEKILFLYLIRKPARLSGAEVFFLRHHLGLTQIKFAKILKVERTIVSKWEKKDLKATGMTIHAEIFLRMKLARLVEQSLDQEFDQIEPGTSAKGVGKPIEIRMEKAS